MIQSVLHVPRVNKLSKKVNIVYQIYHEGRMNYLISLIEQDYRLIIFGKNKYGSML